MTKLVIDKHRIAQGGAKLEEVGARPVMSLADTPLPSAAEDYKVVCVRMRSTEYEAFAEVVNRRKLTNSMALRIAARRVAGFLEIDAAVRLQLEALVEKIGELSVSIRALHEAYIDDRAVNMSVLEAQRSAFGEKFAELDALLRTILNVSRRRSDGRRMLDEVLL